MERELNRYANYLLLAENDVISTSHHPLVPELQKNFDLTVLPEMLHSALSMFVARKSLKDKMRYSTLLN